MSTTKPATNHRQALEQALASLRAQGVTPTIRLLRERAGGGSFSTIVSVLRGDAASQPRGVYSPANNASAPPPAIAAPNALATQALRPETAQLSESAPAITSYLQHVAESLGALHDEVHKLRESHAEELKLAYERFESVQKYSLMEVHTARERAQAAQRALQEARAGVRTREDVLLGQAAQLREQVAFLKGKVSALGGRPDEGN